MIKFITDEDYSLLHDDIVANDRHYLTGNGLKISELKGAIVALKDYLKELETDEDGDYDAILDCTNTIWAYQKILEWRSKYKRLKIRVIYVHEDAEPILDDADQEEMEEFIKEENHRNFSKLEAEQIVKVEKASQYAGEQIEIRLSDGKALTEVKETKKRKRKVKRAKHIAKKRNIAPKYPIREHMFEFIDPEWKRRVNESRANVRNIDAKSKDDGAREKIVSKEVVPLEIVPKKLVTKEVVPEVMKKEVMLEEKSKKINLVCHKEKKARGKRRKYKSSRIGKDSRKLFGDDNSNLDESRPEFVNEEALHGCSINFCGRSMAISKEAFTRIDIERNGHITIKSQTNQYFRKRNRNFGS